MSGIKIGTVLSAKNCRNTSTSISAIDFLYRLHLFTMILIVDDKPENIFSLKTILELHSFPTDTALSGEEALELQTLEMNLSPADRRFYTSLAKAQARRLCIHLYVAHPYNLSVAFS